MKPEDFKWLCRLVAGGPAYIQAESPLNVEGVIYENVSFFSVPRRAPGAQMPGQMKVIDGDAIYDTPTSEGKMTFQEAGSEWVWRWQGKTRIGDRAVTRELRKPK